MASTTSSSDVCASNSKPRNLPDNDLIRGFLLSPGTTCLSPADPTAFSRSRMQVCRRIAGIIKKNQHFGVCHCGAEIQPILT